MKSRALILITMTLFAALAIPLRLAAQQQQKDRKEHPLYRVTDLGALGGTSSVAYAINNRGWIVGDVTLRDNKVHAFLWRSGLKTDLGTLGGPNSSATFPLNERGEVPGAAEPPSTPDPNGEDFCALYWPSDHLICLPFLWQKDVMSPLPTLGGNNGIANEVNNRGQVVGVAENSTPDPTCVAPQVLQTKPVIWEDSEIEELPTFPGDPDGFVNAINDKGQAVGASGNCFTSSAGIGIHALLWQRNDEGEFKKEEAPNDWTVTDLGNLGGTTNNLSQDINNQGQVVGFSGTSDAAVHAFLWTKANGIQDLGTVQEDAFSFGFGINSKGQVVGTSCDKTFTTCRAFLRQNGAMTDLNSLLPPGSPLFLLHAFNINSRGEIVGDALQMSTGEVHAYLARPCERDDVNTEGCRNDDADTPGTRSGTNESPKVTLPDNVRKLLLRRLPFGRFGAGPMRPQ